MYVYVFDNSVLNWLTVQSDFLLFPWPWLPALDHPHGPLFIFGP